MKVSPAARLRLARVLRGYETAKSFAAKHGIPQPTYATHEAGTRTLTKETAEKYANLLAVSTEWILFGTGAGPGSPEQIAALSAPIAAVPVVGKVQAGEWVPAIRWDDDQVFMVSVPTDARYAHCQKFGLVTRGRSMDRIYPDGTILICVDLVQLGGDPEPGQRVICQRRDPHTDLVEATVKEYVVDDGRHWLWPRSTDPAHQQPIELKPEYAADEESVRVMSLVIGSYRPEA